MALIFADRIWETTTTTSTGTYTLDGAKIDYKAFSTACTTNDTCYYVATDGTNYEIGLGTYTSSGNTLARTTILSNSAGDTNPISWGAGTKDIFLDAPALLFNNLVSGPVVQTFTDGVGFTAGTSTTITLSAAPPNASSLQIQFDGLTQFHNTWTLAGTVVTFSSVIPSGVQNIEAFWTINYGGVVVGGTAASPGISTVLSNTTGIYSDTTNTLGISTAGTSRIYIDSTGRVGIGTNSPSYKLDISDSGDMFRLVSSTSASSILLTDTSNTIRIGSSSGACIIDVASATRLTISTSGTLTVPGVYNNTTATAANVNVDSTGLIRRSTSSLRYKNSVTDYTKGIDDLEKLRPVFYKSNNDGDKLYAGLIAEEVDAAGFTEFVQYNDEGLPDALSYSNMISLCIKAIKDLNNIVKTQSSEIETLKNIIKELTP
jgi:hypothetical protein